MYNRKQRRELEKSSGLLKEYQKMSHEDKAKIRERRRLAGQQIHLQNVQEAENAAREREAESEAKLFQSLTENGMSEEQAKGILERNQKVRAERAERIRKRQEKRK